MGQLCVWVKEGLTVACKITSAHQAKLSYRWDKGEKQDLPQWTRVTYSGTQSGFLSLETVSSLWRDQAWIRSRRVFINLLTLTWLVENPSGIWSTCSLLRLSCVLWNHNKAWNNCCRDSQNPGRGDKYAAITLKGQEKPVHLCWLQQAFVSRSLVPLSCFLVFPCCIQYR